MTVPQTQVLSEAPAPRRPVPLILVNASFCKRCGICIYFCPTRVFDVREDGLPLVNRRDDCIWCGLCEVRCPDFAITLRDEGGASAGGEGRPREAGLGHGS